MTDSDAYLYRRLASGKILVGVTFKLFVKALIFLRPYYKLESALPGRQKNEEKKKTRNLIIPKRQSPNLVDEEAICTNYRRHRRGAGEEMISPPRRQYNDF